MFDRIISFNNLLSAYYKARRHKRFQKPLQIFEFNLEKNLINLQAGLITNQYRPKKYHRFITFEPKKRQISAPAFIDRILHHAIITVIEPIFEKVFINHSFACRKGKGTHFGMLQVSQAYHQTHQYHPRFYCLKCDIKSYFASINHQILLRLLSKHIPCPKTIKLLTTIITSYHDTPGRGIPIGNLTSQIFANIYLHPLDLYLTQTLKVKNYFRYMDDFLVISPDKEYLLALRHQIDTFLTTNLKLTLHPKKNNIFRADRGLDFLGYLIKPHQTTIRKKTLRRYKKRHKKRLKKLKTLKHLLKNHNQPQQLSLFTPPPNPANPDLSDQITALQQKLRSSRNSFKGLLRYSTHQRLSSGGITINNITRPNISPKKTNKP